MQACLDANKDCAKVSLDLWGLIMMGVAATIPLYIMCCCTAKPVRTMPCVCSACLFWACQHASSGRCCVLVASIRGQDVVEAPWSIVVGPFGQPRRHACRLRNP